MRLALIMTFLLALAGCASQPQPPTTAFDAHPQYPLTVVHVSPSLTLRHIAGTPCDYQSTVRPKIGSEGTRTYSTYELVDASGTKAFTAPSMLSDPKYEGEFESYYRKNDQITVLTSNSKNTILIIEDRSPTGSGKAHILLRHKPGSSWTWSQIDVPLLWPPSGGPPDRYFPQVVGLSDTRIWFRAEGRTWSQLLDKSKPPA